MQNAEETGAPPTMQKLFKGGNIKVQYNVVLC